MNVELSEIEKLPVLYVEYNQIDLVLKQTMVVMGGWQVVSGSLGEYDILWTDRFDNALFNYEIIGKDVTGRYYYVLVRPSIFKKYKTYLKSWLYNINRKILITLTVWDLMNTPIGSYGQWRDLKILQWGKKK